MALTFLLAAKQIGKYNVQLKRASQLHKKIKQKPFNQINLPCPREMVSKFNLEETSENFLKPPYIRCIEIYVKKRRYHTIRKYSNEPPAPESPPLPKVFYFQNPFTWAVNKFDLKILEKAWDPAFNQIEFVKGSKQAISTVTQLVSRGADDDLKGLLTRGARASLDDDVSQAAASGLLPLLGLQPSNIQVAAPRRVRFLKYEDRKFCDVDMMFVALKWVSQNRADGLIYLEIFASFRREYTQYSIPEWTIAFFKIIKVDILDR